MEPYDDSELWVSEDEDEEEHELEDNDPIFFHLEMNLEEGRPGGKFASSFSMSILLRSLAVSFYLMITNPSLHRVQGSP